MGEDRGFTVHDRRKVKPEEGSAETKGEHSPETEGEAGPTGGGEGSAGTGGGRARPLPPVDFSGFVLGLAQMALVHLGELPEPMTGMPHVDLEQARHSIDILDMLKDKTEGNLTAAESGLLQHLRSELKLKYVRSAKP